VGRADASYDGLGRLTDDTCTSLGSGVDGAVRRIETVYDVRGQVQKIRALPVGVQNLCATAGPGPRGVKEG